MDVTDLNLYGVFNYIAIIITGLFVTYTYKHRKRLKKHIFYSYIYEVVGFLIGAKILYILTNFEQFCINVIKVSENINNVTSILMHGFVFCGGLIGAVLTIYIYSKQYDVNFNGLLVVHTPGFCILYSFGKLGCYFNGCCGGIFLAGLNDNLPIQLIESLCSFLILLILVRYYIQYNANYKGVLLYCVLFGSMKFVLDFFRSPQIRNVIAIFTISQWISLFMIMFGIIGLIKGSKFKA